MKIKILFLFLFPFITLSSLELKTNKDDKFVEYLYFFLENPMNLNIVNGVFTPFIGMGGRQIMNRNGIDWNFSLEPYILAKSHLNLLSYQLNINYLRFTDPKHQNRYFYGLGGNILGIICSEYFYILRSPLFIVGKEITDKNKKYIIQLKIAWPHFPAIWIKNYSYKFNREERNKRRWIANFFVTTGIGF